MPFQYNPLFDGLSSPTSRGTQTVETNFGWNLITADKAQNAQVLNGSGIICRGSGAVSITLVFDKTIFNRRLQIVGAGQALWKVQLLAGQIVQFGNKTITKSVAATEPSDCLELIYVGGNTWAQCSSVGNLDIN